MSVKTQCLGISAVKKGYWEMLESRKDEPQRRGGAEGV